MKAQKLIEIKTNYSFEEAVLPASIPAGNAGKEKIDTLDLNELLVPKPKGTYLVKVNGESMIDANIFEGDVLLVDGKTEPKDGDIVVAALDGEMAVKKYRIEDCKIFLHSANKKFQPIEIKPLMEFQIQGVVKYVIHTLF